MKRLGFTIIFTLLISNVVSAGTRSCTTSMVTLNICRSTSDVAYCLPIGTVDPDGAGPLLPPSTNLADAFASIYNWQTPTPCTSVMVSAGICTAPQLGTLVPITKAQFADIQVRAYVLDVMKRYNKQKAIDAAATSADAVADPDIGN